MMTMTEELVITKHAYTRMKERNGWNKKAATRMVSRIYNDGMRPSQVKGYLKSWVNNKYKYSNDGDEYVLFLLKIYDVDTIFCSILICFSDIPAGSITNRSNRIDIKSDLALITNYGIKINRSIATFNC